jgi:spermidine synthase
MDIFLGLLGCIAAVFIGAYLAKKQARTFSGQSNRLDTNHKPGDGELPTVTHFDYGNMRFLHLGSPAVQGSMKISKPLEIHLEYQQRMMAWLLFADLEKIKHLHAMQLGLGAASLTKFCNMTLGLQTTAVELNPMVIETCKLWFNLPDNNNNLQVLLGDAAEAVTRDEWQAKVDVLQVDLYDQDAECPVIDTESFYYDCKKLLTEGGCMTVNIFGRHSNAKESAQKIARVYADGTVWIFKPTKAGNSIVIALRTSQKMDRSELSFRAQAIESRWPLPARQWPKVLTPFSLS